MSFFFNKAKQQPKKVAAPKTTVSSKDTLNRLGCQACPLNRVDNATPKMEPIITEETDIYILGEQPTEIDDDKGVPFSDEYGKMVDSILRGSHLAYDNVIRDFDPTGTATQWIAMECCRSRITDAIERAKPKFIVGLGILPLQWMLGSADMVGLRGRVFSVRIGQHACYFMPSYHPKYVTETAYDKKAPLKSKLGHCLKFDLLKAQRLAKKLPPPVIDAVSDVRAAIQAFNGRGAGQLAAVLRLISEARKAPVKAIDLETSHLRPYSAGARILTVAVSYENTNFAFALNHPTAGWRPADIRALTDGLADVLLSKGTIVAHNTPFECEWLISLLGTDIVNHEAWECTMMQAHFLDERRGKRGGNDEQFQPNPYQALDFLVRMHFGINYKSIFKLDRKRMVDADLDETLLYNAADTKYTLRLYERQSYLLREAGLWEAYKEAAQRQPTVALMQSFGICIDQNQTMQMQRKLGDEIKLIESEIADLPEVKQFIADRKAFNPASNHDLLKIFKDYIKVGKALIGANGKETTDKSALAKIAHPLAKLVDDHRNRSKLKSTYVDVFSAVGNGQFIYPDGRIHPSFNTTFAETGRTSSDGPNQQNWPQRRDSYVRRQVTAPKGRVLLAFDYGQLEACTAAMCTRDKVLVKALWEDYDIHMEWTERAAYIWPELIGGIKNLKDEKIMKKARSLIKNKLVFPAMFGASNKSVASYLNAPQEKIDKLMDEFWRTFTGLAAWQRRLMDDYYNNGFVESPTGRRRHYPLTKNQAVNYPIQSVACDIVCRAMVALSRHALDSGKYYLHPVWNIHDDLGFAIPNNDEVLSDAIETIYKEMLTPGYDFINVPLSVSGSIGTNWLEMDEKVIGKYWSHKL
jgi:uracil-DNA glycosylase family 4